MLPQVMLAKLKNVDATNILGSGNVERCTGIDSYSRHDELMT